MTFETLFNEEDIRNIIAMCQKTLEGKVTDEILFYNLENFVNIINTKREIKLQGIFLSIKDCHNLLNVIDASIYTDVDNFIENTNDFELKELITKIQNIAKEYKDE